jgi:hypothetical protein
MGTTLVSAFRTYNHASYDIRDTPRFVHPVLIAVVAPTGILFVWLFSFLFAKDGIPV